MSDQTQYLSQQKLTDLKRELADLKENKIPALAKRIDDARQMGDLSENAEYHAAREEMSWAQSRAKEVEHILNNAELLPQTQQKGLVTLSTTLTIKSNGVTRQYMIVGAQEANPAQGKISNESPLGQAFIGKKPGDKIQVKVPVGIQVYEILSIE